MLVALYVITMYSVLRYMQTVELGRKTDLPDMIVRKFFKAKINKQLVY